MLNGSHHAYKVQGGKPVVGEIRCLGAKNFTTKAMVAALLGKTPTTLTNVPEIGDVKITADLLTSIGVKVDRTSDGTMTIDASTMNSSNVSLPLLGSNRIPILLLSVLLQRFQKVSVPALGGCRIGDRKVDFHLEAIKQFGGDVEQTEGFLAHRVGKLKGTHVKLPYPSVGATETCLYLGVLAEGRTVISNAAIEPEVFELINMFRSMGALIFTSPEREIRIEGVQELTGTWMQAIGDRIEAASWACLACATKGEIIVHGIQPDILSNFLSYFQQIGGGFDFVGSESIRFFRKKPLNPLVVRTDVYPGFSTDWQQPFAVLLTQADGISIIHETVYEDRFSYLQALNKLGAKTKLSTYCLEEPCRYWNAGYKHSAIIVGPTTFSPTDYITVSDLRAGLACVIAAALTHGTTIITNIHLIERGYGDIAPRLTLMNLKIEKILV
jgi:UDP-N-acetylglucosamine 1-carboxyvinyltransferase